ncbi:hypothetical protein Hypma_002212 [Hypsizygus marmoreus]|uniref:Uncharacterized protein n=1 Tax=Hypsizygus marmoreus TaxID=39966 RepID=A0A369JZX0_HYPMA|nr:hypothetical protein Hypma_002212 [Hypsizygus marmoreus]
MHTHVILNIIDCLIMRATGAGSQSSPIFIDDSEDEVIQELCDTSVESYSNPTPHAPLSPVSPDYSNSYAFPVERTSYGRTNYEMNNYQQGGQESQGKRAQKRKRTEIDQRNVSFAGPSHPMQPIASLDARLSNKKAKKRRRKLEAQSRHHIHTNSANLFSKHEHAPLPRPHQWPVDSMAYSSDNFAPPPFAYDDRLSYSAQASQSYHHQHYYSDNTDSVAASTSSWVSSMALAAAEPPVPEPMQPWESYPRLPEWHPPPLPPLPIPPLPVEPLSKPPPIPTLHPRPTPVAKKVKHNVPEPIPAPLPAPVALPKPAPAAPIGMQPDQDPSSKHGLFQIPASTSSSGTAPAEPYIPNPARTLVVEQLPKTHRTKDFVNTWSKSACGAYPVHVIVDAPAAKALVEFATAELARKAWSSPKLGANLAGLKTHQLKGKPREDLIKAWWYRVVGVGAGAGVGEIEEGEIEGDATEKEVEVPAKKETKKEKKARLARERLAKQQNLLKAAAKVPAVEAPDEHEPTPSTSYVAQPLEDDTVASIPALPPSAVPPVLVHPLPYHLPPPSYAFAHIPPATPLHAAPTPYLPPQPPTLPTYVTTHISPPAPPPSRTPLPPQAALDTHWRPKHELPKKPEKAPLGTSTAVNGSISSQTAPQAPLQESRRDIRYPPADDDMDIEVDMEIDSPQTGRRALYDAAVPPVVEMEIEAELPLPRTPSPIPADLSGPSATLTVEAVTSIFSRTASLSTAPPHILPQFDVLSSSATPPLSAASPSPSVTPSLAPSEPKAMKNAPKGPSYAKRSLLARQKELEERIAKSKMEIARLSAGSVPPTPPVPTTPPPPDSTSANQFNGSLEHKQAMEDRLRSLVMKSQKNKTRSLLSPPPSTASPMDSSHPPISASPTPSSSVTAVSPVLSATPISTITTHAFSLDDLAVSFITETIQTYKALPPPIPAPISAPKPPSRINTKLELAAKQKRLEQQITESKVLMEQLAQAKTKQDKDRILAAMRERSRMMEEEDKTSQSPVSTTTTTFASAASTTIKHSQYGADQPPQAGVMRWPDSHHDAGVLIVSDDEGDSDSEDDDDWA